jgi:hypothetical protein
MSALGQKQTSERVQSMSALPPKADIGTQSWNIRFVPGKLMSGATGAIAALALDSRHHPASAVKKQKQISPTGPIRKTA